MKKLALTSLLVTLPLISTGCSTFSRSNEKTRYSAAEPASPDELKDQKIQHLESTVTSLNSRIQELEGKLQAAEVRPMPSNASEMSAKATNRQILDGANAGGKVRASVAGNDPGAGFVNDASVRAFQQGRVLFDQEKYPEAILAFSAFLESNPGHALASSAQYNIAECYYREADFAVADQEFQKLTTRYPQSPRISYALVRLSQSAGALGKTDEAKRYRTQAEGLFPKSPAMKLFRETPVTATDAARAAVSDSAAHATTPIATAPDLTIERPSVPPIPAPTIETPTVEAPRVEIPAGNAPRARISGDDLDAPPGGGG